jgi:hypothetical protein
VAGKSEGELLCVSFVTSLGPISCEFADKRAEDILCGSTSVDEGCRKWLEEEKMDDILLEACHQDIPIERLGSKTSWVLRKPLSNAERSHRLST